MAQPLNLKCGFSVNVKECTNERTSKQRKSHIEQKFLERPARKGDLNQFQPHTHTHYAAGGLMSLFRLYESGKLSVCSTLFFRIVLERTDMLLNVKVFLTMLRKDSFMRCCWCCCRTTPKMVMLRTLFVRRADASAVVFVIVHFCAFFSSHSFYISFFSLFLSPFSIQHCFLSCLRFHLYFKWN